MKEKIRVAVIDPYPLFRQGIMQTIEHAGELALVAEGATLRDAQRALREQHPDVLIIDSGGLPDGGGDGVPEFLRTAAQCKLVILTSLDDVPSVSKARSPRACKATSSRASRVPSLSRASSPSPMVSPTLPQNWPPAC